MSVRLGGPTLLVLACLILPSTVQGADSSALMAERLRGLKELQREQLLREPSERLERFREWRKRGQQPGNRLRRRPKLPGGDLGETRRLGMVARSLIPTPLAASVVVNTMANDTTGENPDFGICESEVSIASYGNYVVAAWNDGIGYEDLPPYTSSQGFGYSTDGGVTWKDGGSPPGGIVGRWSSDPVVAVNEKTGRFYFSALCEPTLTTGGIGVVSGSFCGSTFSWGTPTLAVTVGNDVAAVDKDWMAVDSLSGNVYLSYTFFTISGGNITSAQIQLQRSTDNGLTWAAPQVLSSPGDAGLVQGSRPAVGPNGEVYAVWSAIGQSEGPRLNSRSGRDFFRIRKSTDGGASFGAEVTADSMFSDFGSGAPGFDRGLGITYPSIAVDRSQGPHRGRVYLIWNESINFYDDPLPDPSDPALALSEVEPNDGPPIATPFTPGQVLRGARTVRGNPGDWDYFKFTGTRGQTFIGYLDSLAAGLDAAFRIFCCTDANTRLGFSQSDFGGKEVLVCTLPADGTYYIRVASYQGGGTGGYRVLTTIDTPGNERARDQRDIFVTSSDDGVHWGPTTRVNDSPAGFDDWLPEIAVDESGRVFEAHYDYRDAAAVCGGAASVYLGESDDGGVTWGPEVPVSNKPTNWTLVYSSLVPGQGDYIGLCARRDAPLVGWGDGRDGDPNVYMRPAPLGCTNPPVTSVSTAGTTHDHMTITWTAPPDFQATVVRIGRGVETRPATLTADASGQMVYVDTDVVPDQTYSYRLEAPGDCVPTCEVLAALPCLGAPPVLVQASSSYDSVVVTWKAPPGQAATIERRDSSGPFVDLLPVTADAESTIVFLDRDIAAGHRYDYRLGVEGFCERFVGQVSVDLPGFAFYGIQPSPARPDVNVSFSLDPAGPATLSLYDVTGHRIVLPLDIGSLGPGPHVVNLTQGVRMKAGIYFVRLTQAGKSKTRRIAIIR